MKKLVFIADIDWKNSPKVRAGLVPEVVDDYAERYRKREDMPLPLVGDLGALGLRCLDGMHRLHGAKKNGQKALQCEVKTCTEEESLKLALIANDSHGLRRSNDDKRQCVKSALLQWSDKSNLAIAQLTRVDDKTVATVRKELEKAGQVDKAVVKKDTKGRDVTPRERKSDLLTDHTGIEIPKDIRGVWQEADIMADNLLTDITGVRLCVIAAQKDKDILFCELNFSACVADMERAEKALESIKPYAVCPNCNGFPNLNEKGCAMCKSRGFVSKFRWDTTVPDEIKKMRKKAASKKDSNNE
jgi:hypothetical protein